MHDSAEGLENHDSPASPIPAERSLEFQHADLSVEDIMTKDIVSVAPLEPIEAAIQKMSEHNISCIVVTEGGRAVGILTERDVLKGAATNYDKFIQGHVAERMSSPVISVPYNWSALAASALMESKGIELVVE